MFSTSEKVKSWYDWAKLNPAAFKAKVVGFFAKLAVVFILMFVAYLQGGDNAETRCKSDAYKNAAATQQVRADNAVDAGKRYGAYTRTQAELDAAVAAAKNEVAAYYAANQPEPRVVNKTQLVPVPGKEELVYVPIGTCPNDLLNPDELRLFNKGNKGSDFDPGHP